MTVQGFASELVLAVGELSAAAEAVASGDGTPEELARRVAEIVRADLDPCIGCISSAATTLAERIDELDTARAA